jgi:thymidine phosphorylase
MPKTSSRSITSPAGTADTFEVLADVSFSLDEMKKIIMKTNACIVWGGSLNLSPADDKIIHVEKPLSIDSRSQLLASVMSKKASVSATHLIIDIPYGRGSKIESVKIARQVKKDFEKIGKMLGIKTKAILTDGKQPIGNGIGPSLEARDVLRVLKQDDCRPVDLEEKAISVASRIFKLVGEKSPRERAESLLRSGEAYRKLVEIINAQHKKVIDPTKIKKAKFKTDFKSRKSGKILHIDNAIISKIARAAGAPIEKAAGLDLYKHVGDTVVRGEKLFTIYSESKFKLEYADEIAKKKTPIIIS